MKMQAEDIDWVTVDALIDLARREDLGGAGDVTSLATIDEGATASAAFVARDGGVLAGAGVVDRVFGVYDASVAVEWLVEDGESIEAGRKLATVAGNLRAILAAERVALNFLCRLSGIATATRKYVDAVAGTSATIVDTRKTAPGWRSLEKYAVRRGGGSNHRMGLYDMVLVKDNHLAACGLADLSTLVTTIRQRVPSEIAIEVEVDTLDQLANLLPAKPELILLDNMTLGQLAEAVAMRNRQFANANGPLLEASGGVTLDTVAAIAATGVDRIAVGAITHSAPILDIALDFPTGLGEEIA